MALRFYNTLSRKVDELALREPGKARIYACGPTVYDYVHVGNARPAVAFDVLARHLRGRGLEVVYVRNLTDIDDKILNRARELGEDPLALSERMTVAYREDMAALGCDEPTHEPKVSDHLPQIFALIQNLVDRGSAYVQAMPAGTRDVYFSVRSFSGYGKLSGRRIDELLVGARVAEDEAKRDPLDFALWKGQPEGEWGWPSPWGNGRPGWHIECSAMSTHYLGHGFDVHGGGMDLIFPHHENEVAQSEAAAPDAGPMARIWMHNGFLNLDKEKMSKSLGNVIRVRDVLERNDGEAYRFYLLGVHYRGPMAFETATGPDGRIVFTSVDEAERRVDYLYATRRRLDGLVQAGLTAPAKVPPDIAAHRDAAEAAGKHALDALDDDLNTSVALAELGEIAKQGNDLADLALRRRKDQSFQGSAGVAARMILLAMERVQKHLGVGRTPPADYERRTRERRLRLRGLTEADVDAKVRARAEARASKDFARADVLRAELTASGIEVHDSPDGSTWTIGV